MYIFLLRKWRKIRKPIGRDEKREVKAMDVFFAERLIAYAGFFPYAITLGKLFVDVDHFFVEVC